MYRYRGYRGLTDEAQSLTGNGILVAMGNNWIQYGGYIKFREEPNVLHSEQQEMNLLVARGNNWIPKWPPNMKYKEMLSELTSGRK